MITVCLNILAPSNIFFDIIGIYYEFLSIISNCIQKCYKYITAMEIKADKNKIINLSFQTKNIYTQKSNWVAFSTLLLVDMFLAVDIAAINDSVYIYSLQRNNFCKITKIFGPCNFKDKVAINSSTKMFSVNNFTSDSSFFFKME